MLFILIKCRSGTEKEVKNAITNIPKVANVNIVAGEFDVIVQLRGDSQSILQGIVFGYIRKVKNVIDTVTLSVIELE
ncbi:MAG: Lrp/AsnC ligand binding domain-containing protein [Candidatus Hodarchaeales archaeon]|jgi:hypothetical protein